jgi:hypothetical protein
MHYILENSPEINKDNLYNPKTPDPTMAHNNGNQHGMLQKLGDLYFHKKFVKQITTASVKDPPNPTRTRKKRLTRK